MGNYLIYFFLGTHKFTKEEDNMLSTIGAQFNGIHIKGEGELSLGYLFSLAAAIAWEIARPNGI